jgi:transcriptional regulator with XRE-family HTH domain
MKTEYDYFGQYLHEKRMERQITLRKFAELTEIVPGYLSDIENRNKPVPEKAILDKMIELLRLDTEETAFAYDLAARERDTIPQDVTGLMKEHDVFVRALRMSRSIGASVEEWEEFILQMERKKRGD